MNAATLRPYALVLAKVCVLLGVAASYVRSPVAGGGQIVER